jgi:hypothetical protein
MFDYSSDSLIEYDYIHSFPKKSTPIVLERVSDPNYAFDSIIPTTPNQQQTQSIHKGELPSLSTRKTSPSLFPKTQTSEQPSDPESPKLPFITNVYIASITIVGLFLLFRMIQK